MIVNTIQTYQDLITSEHSDKPNFVAFYSGCIQPFVDLQAFTISLLEDFDLDLAIGVQLDAVGLWVGVSRVLKTAITGVFFSFNVDGLGFNQGVWKGPFSGSGVTLMPDYIYRTIIKFKILANHWNGTIPQAYEDFSTLFTNGEVIYMRDNQDMSMTIGLVGFNFDALSLAILEQGYFPFRPEGVRIKEYIIPPTDKPIFAFNKSGGLFGGFNVGYFAKIIRPE